MGSGGWMWWNFSGSARLSGRMPKPSMPTSLRRLKRWIHRVKTVKDVQPVKKRNWTGLQDRLDGKIKSCSSRNPVKTLPAVGNHFVVHHFASLFVSAASLYSSSESGCKNSLSQWLEVFNLRHLRNLRTTLTLPSSLFFFGDRFSRPFPPLTWYQFLIPFSP